MLNKMCISACVEPLCHQDFSAGKRGGRSNQLDPESPTCWNVIGKIGNLDEHTRLRYKGLRMLATYAILTGERLKDKKRRTTIIGKNILWQDRIRRI